MHTFAAPIYSWLPTLPRRPTQAPIRPNPYEKHDFFGMDKAGLPQPVIQGTRSHYQDDAHPPGQHSFAANPARQEKVYYFSIARRLGLLPTSLKHPASSNLRPRNHQGRGVTRFSSLPPAPTAHPLPQKCSPLIVLGWGF